MRTYGAALFPRMPERRRLILSLPTVFATLYGHAEIDAYEQNVRFWHKADISRQIRDVCFEG